MTIRVYKPPRPKNNFEAVTEPTANDDVNDGYEVGSRWVDTATDIHYVCLDATAGAAIWAETSLVYGTESGYIEALDEASTTSTTYVQRLRFTSADIPAGTYRIGWSALQATAKASLSVGFRVQLDDTTDLTEYLSQIEVVWPDSYHPHGGFRYVVLTSGVHTVDVDHRTESGPGGGSYIKDVTIEFWRVA